MQFSSEDVAALRLQVVQSMLDCRNQELSEARSIIDALLKIVLGDENPEDAGRLLCEGIEFSTGELQTIKVAHEFLTT